MGRLMVALFFVLLSGWMLWWMWEESGVLRIVEVKVYANSDKVKEFVEKVVSPLRGEHFLRINFAELKRDILANSMIKEVNFFLRLPGEMIVKVYERTPYYCVVSGEVYVADKDGTVYKQWEGEACRVTVAGKWDRYLKKKVDEIVANLKDVDGVYVDGGLRVYMSGAEIVLDPEVSEEKIKFVRDVVRLLKPKRVDARYYGNKVAVLR